MSTARQKGILGGLKNVTFAQNFKKQ